MKIVAVGIGQCGCNVADALYKANKHSESFFGRRAEILVDAFAVNTAASDLVQLRHIPNDKNHRIIIGKGKTFGHGVGKMNQVAAEIFEEEYEPIISAMTKSEKFQRAEAYIVVASGGGGTGSGGISRIVKALKERLLTSKPVYGMVILPFKDEEIEKNSLAVLNAATCVSTLYEVADAVILVDNERFIERERSLVGNVEAINSRIAESFFDLFCAGEERRRKYIGRKVMEAGDIKECIGGLTTLGLGYISLPVFRSLKKSFGGSNYLEDSGEEDNVFSSLGQAIEQLGVKCNLLDARKIGCLVCAHWSLINEGVMGAIKRALSDLAPEALIRVGDYPRRGKDITTTLIVGELGSVERIEKLYEKAKEVLKNIGDLEKIKQEQRNQLIEKAKDLPKLL